MDWKPKYVFDGKCKDCPNGKMVEESGELPYIACQVGGIREPDQGCNIFDRTPAQEQEPELEQWQIDLLEEFTLWLGTVEGHTTDRKLIREKIDGLFVKYESGRNPVKEQ